MLFAVSLQGFSIVLTLDPQFFLILLCVLLFYFEVLVICGGIVSGARAVRKEKRKEQGQQDQPKNEQGEAPADV